MTAAPHSAAPAFRDPWREPVHRHFGISRAEHLVLHRVLLQSMPPSWQQRFVRCLDELEAAFDHIQLPNAYDVVPGEEYTLAELDEDTLHDAGIVPDHSDDETRFLDHDGTPLAPEHAVLLPVDANLPSYRTGFVEPDEDARQAAAAHHETVIALDVPAQAWTQLGPTARFGRWVISTGGTELVLLGHHEPAAALASAYAELAESAGLGTARALLAPGAERAVETGCATYNPHEHKLTATTAGQPGSIAVTWVRMPSAAAGDEQ